jgi:hypothetical protein
LQLAREKAHPNTHGKYLHNAKAHAPRSAGAGDGRGVGIVAWGGHENWAADRGCHAATCSDSSIIGSWT